MARLARKAMADMRAVEEEDERMNPLSGRGATPSMGLSQFRGGVMPKKIDLSRRPFDPTAKKKIDVSKFMPKEESESGEEMVGGRIVGAGKREAKELGMALGKHLDSLHGRGYAEDFREGLHLALKDQTPMDMPPPPVAPESDAPMAVGSGTKKGQMRKTARKAYEGGIGTGAYEGKGTLHITHEGGAIDKRKQRGALLSKLMKEKGMKLPEASKYIKEHGLM